MTLRRVQPSLEFIEFHQEILLYVKVYYTINNLISERFYANLFSICFVQIVSKVMETKKVSDQF